MSEKVYMICMQTPLGKREGTLIAEKDREILSGWLDILKHREPFEGVVDADGNCTISGELVTLTRRMAYVATGQISDSSLHLKVKGERNIYELSGIARQESEE